MRHDDVLGEEVLLEEADNVRQVIMQTACPALLAVFCARAAEPCIG